MKSINKVLLALLRQKALVDISSSITQRTVTANGIFKSSENTLLTAANISVFSHEIDTKKVTNQNSSGTCWLFSTLNILRHDIAKTHKLDEFELSQSYLFFWDKLEKSNLFYEQIILLADKPFDDRLMEHLLRSPQHDGGWWEMSVALIKKYGVVPKQVMPDSAVMTNTKELNRILNKKLRKDALELRKLISNRSSDQEIEAVKEKMLHEIYKILIISIGTPPENFDFIYKDKNKKYHRDIAITPHDFLKKYSKINFNNYVSIGNDPSPNKIYGEQYTIENCKNIAEGNAFQFLNVEMKTLIKLAVMQIKKGEPVWFACDIDVDTTKNGFMDTDVYDFENTFKTTLFLSKADRLVTRDSTPTHSMLLTGVDIVKGEPTNWKIENSWGEDYGNKGYYTMSTEWMNQNGFIAVIRRDLLPQALKQILNKEPVHLSPWDPLNAAKAL